MNLFVSKIVIALVMAECLRIERIDRFDAIFVSMKPFFEQLVFELLIVFGAALLR